MDGENILVVLGKIANTFDYKSMLIPCHVYLSIGVQFDKTKYKSLEIVIFNTICKR